MSISALRTKLAVAQANFVRKDALAKNALTAWNAGSEVISQGDVSYAVAEAHEARARWTEAETALNEALRRQRIAREAKRPAVAPIGQIARITHWKTA